MIVYSVTPIAVFAYNRVRHFEITLEALGRADSFDACELFIFCDAGENVEQVRQVAHEFVGRRGGQVIEREEPRGYRNIVEGVTEMCERFGRVIVIEDDIVISPDFLSYCIAALDRYEHEERVYLVSGQMYADVYTPHPPTVFLPATLIWGWATWQRAWQHFTWEPDGWQQLLEDTNLRKRFDLGGTMPFSHYLKWAMNGRMKSWAIRWGCTVFNNGGLGLYPWRAMTWNCGAGSGVHGLGRGDFIDHKIDFIHGKESRCDYRLSRLESGFDFPDKIEVDEQAFDHLVNRLKKWHSLPSRLRRIALRGGSVLGSYFQKIQD